MPIEDTKSQIDESKMRISGRPALAGWPMILAWMAMIIFAFHASTHMVGAGDTWVAMACGRHFINHGVDTVEPFSANSHKAGPTEEDIEKWPSWARSIAQAVGLRTVQYWHPTGWINQNWLTHVIFYWLTHLSPFADAHDFSFNTLVYWKFAVYILTVICVYYTGRVLGANGALSAAFACFAMFVGRSFFDIRPAGFSNILLAAFLLTLVLTTYRNILYIWLIVPIATFWCNVHGGYIYIFIMLVPFVALNLLTCLSKKWFVSIGLKGIYHTMAAGFVAFLATIVFNPFHLTNLTHTFVISVSEHAKMWRTVNEWHPGFEWANPVGTGFPFLVMYMLCFGVTIFWVCSRRLLPKYLKAPRNELEQQRRLFLIMSRVGGFTAAIFLGWVTFIGFSWLDLNAGSFFICAVFMGILLVSIFKNIHFIWFQIPLVLLALWATGTRAKFGGTYIYPFVLIPSFVTVYILASLFSKKLKTKPVDIAFVAGSAVAALVLMVILFAPFKKLESLWNLGQFWDLKRIWVPRYEGKYKVHYANLFPVLYVINLVCVLLWLFLPWLKKLFAELSKAREPGPESEPYQLAKIDLAQMAIAALTVYMAVRSRRFIPVAAFAACPVLAAFVDQMARAIASACKFHGLAFAAAGQNNAGQKQNRLVVPPMPYGLQVFFVLVGIAAVLGFGSWWGLKFKTVYLDPWPTDPKLTSVFMRMTASDAKPFWALQFIRENKLEGKMFNYWTEGGFIAWGQDADPNSGFTALRLFMDGRAQAAYEPDAYRTWSDIMAGGRIATRLTADARERGRRLSGDDYVKIGNWIDKRLQKHKVWAVMMPAGQFTSSFVRGLEHDSDWRQVFFNNKQKLLVDIRDPRAKRLFDGLFDGTTVYPDDFSRYLMLAHRLLMPGKTLDDLRQGYDYAVQAFRLRPSAAPMRKIIYAARFPQLRPMVDKFCRDYVDELAENKEDWTQQNGYHHHISAALNAASYLRQSGQRRGDQGHVKLYTAKMKEYNEEGKKIVATKRW